MTTFPMRAAHSQRWFALRKSGVVLWFGRVRFGLGYEVHSLSLPVFSAARGGYSFVVYLNLWRVLVTVAVSRYPGGAR